MVTATGKLFAILTAAACLVLTSACSSSGQLLGQNDEAQDQPADEEDTPADPPEQVTGAYLKVFCDAEGFTVDKDYNIDSTPIVACVVKNDDGSRYADQLASVFSEVFKANGDLVSSETVVAPNPPWHFYIKTSAAERKDIVLGKFKIATANETNEVTTNVFDHPLHQDPFLKGLVAIMMARPNDKQRDIGRTNLSDAKKANLVGHMIFPTDGFVTGAVTLEQADALCEQEGDKVEQRDWKALLSTPDVAAAQRIPITGRVYNMRGAHVSAYPSKEDFENGALKPEFWSEAFWRRQHAAMLDMTPTGRQVNLFEVVDRRLKVLDFAWTGTESDGVLSEKYGSCDGWSVSDTTVRGKINILTRTDNFAAQRVLVKKHPEDPEPLPPPESMSCDAKARLICISL